MYIIFLVPVTLPVTAQGHDGDHDQNRSHVLDRIRNIRRDRDRDSDSDGIFIY